VVDIVAGERRTKRSRLCFPGARVDIEGRGVAEGVGRERGERRGWGRRPGGGMVWVDRAREGERQRRKSGFNFCRCLARLLLFLSFFPSSQ
jgi:hypothetical protein